MRVVHVTPYFAPAFCYGGPPRTVLGLCQGLQAAGVDVEVVTTTANGGEDLPASSAEGECFQGVPVHYAARAFPRRLFGARMRVPLSAALARADLCHIHSIWNVPEWSAARLARAHNVPYVLSPRGMLQPAAMARHRTLKALAYWGTVRSHLASAAFLHATSPAEARQLTTFGPPVISIANGVAPVSVTPADVRDLRGRADIGADDEVVTFLGRLHPIKRLDLLAEAFAILRRVRPRARLLIAGPDEGGHRRQIEPLFAETADAIRWLGALDGAAKWALLAASRTLVQCSDSESFGMNVAEALAAGLPVVVTDRGPWAQVESVGCGYAVPHDPRSIADAVVRLLDDPAEARAMGARGKAWAERMFAWDAIGRSMRDAYQCALARVRVQA